MDRLKQFARMLQAVEKVRQEKAAEEDADLTKTITAAIARAYPKTSRARARYEVTQKEAAAELGVSLRTVQKWENGGPNPWGYSREKRLNHATFAAFVASLKRDLSTGEKMLEGVRDTRTPLHLGNRKGMGVKKGTK